MRICQPRKLLSPRRGVTLATLLLAPAVFGQQVTYFPYLQLGDNGPLGTTDQVVVAWQTSETTPNTSSYRVDFGLTTGYGSTISPSARVVDNYLSIDSTLPVSPTTYGAHSDYTAILTGLSFDTTYYYRVSGPGMPANGFTASFHTRKLGSVFSFAVEGDEGYFPVVPNSSPAKIVDYEARIAHLIYNAGSISVQGSASRPAPDFILNAGDNVYTVSSEGNYRDFFFPVFNSDTDTNETGAPIIRSMLYYIVDGN
ncbi:MAG: fibronectin type III domain-containing protein, partial [Acidobacteriaceae bacterium]|nr:fibronectin type III domain-containing protein [Acidobacteriaceae bacterium]